MNINAVISYLGAWQDLQQNRQLILQELQQALEAIHFSILPTQKIRYVRREHRTDKFYTEEKYLASPRDLVTQIVQHLSTLNWKRDVRLHRMSHRSSRHMRVDFVKDNVGLEVFFGKSEFVESKLFVVFPQFIQANTFQIAVVLVPMQSLARRMTPGVGSFESISDTLLETHPIPLRYPFAILGFSDEETVPEVIELTSELDRFLINLVGLSLEQMALLNERPNYDFKVQLPDNKKLAQEVCAFANLPGGGFILIGVDKEGKAIGIPKGKVLDDIQLQFTNIVSDSCKPRPHFEFHLFDTPNKVDSYIIVTEIQEIERKPCMVHEKVYIRSGPSARPADSEEIRRLILR